MDQAAVQVVEEESPLVVVVQDVELDAVADNL